MNAWPDFYDPDLYEQKVGPGLRVCPAYIEFFAKEGPKLLAEYGCGPGEILIELARAGHSVIGLDRSEQMVNRARLRASEEPDEVSRRITVLHTRLEESTLPRLVDAVIMTNELVLHILEPADLVRAFSLARKQLANAGRIVLDVPLIDFALLARASGSAADSEYCRGHFPMADGTTLRVSEHVIFSANSWRKEMVFRYERIAADGRSAGALFRRLEQRVWTVQEIRFALQLAGAGEVTSLSLNGFLDRVFISAERGTAP